MARQSIVVAMSRSRAMLGDPDGGAAAVIPGPPSLIRGARVAMRG